MHYVLNVWVYECSSVVNEEIAVKEGDYIPRILNWRVVGVKPKFEMFMFSIFIKVATIFIYFKLQLFLVCWLYKFVLECMYHYTTDSWGIDCTWFAGQSSCISFNVLWLLIRKYQMAFLGLRNSPLNTRKYLKKILWVNYAFNLLLISRNSWY